MRPEDRFDRQLRLCGEGSERRWRWIPESIAGRQPRYRTIGLHDIRERGIRDAQPLRRLAAFQPAAANEAAATVGSLPIHAQRHVTGGQPAGTERVDHEHAVLRQQGRGADERAERVLGAVEVGKNAGKDGKREPIATTQLPDVAVSELDPTGGPRRTKAAVRLDPRVGALQQRRRPVDSDDAARSPREQRTEEAPRPTAKIDRGAAVTARHLAIEDVVLVDLVVLDVVDFGQQRRVDRLAGKDVAQPPRLPPPPCFRSSVQARSTSSGRATSSTAVAARTWIAFGSIASPSAPPAWAANSRE